MSIGAGGAGRARKREGIASALGVVAGAADALGDALGSTARTGRFLQERLRFRTRPDDVFICSYPRSGTTWLQQILLVLAHDGEPECDHISELSPWFERNLALGRKTAADFEQLPSPRIFKSHLPFSWLPRGARYVYAIRDGRDVAVSYFHLYRSHLGFRGEFDAFFERFMAGDVQYGSWFKHVAAWRAQAASPDVHLVEYESLKRDLSGTMESLSGQLGLPLNGARVRALSPLCTFEHMKASEARFDHATEELAMRGMATGSFIRKGETGGHAELFDAAKLARFDTAHHRPPRAPNLELRLHAFLR